MKDSGQARLMKAPKNMKKALDLHNWSKKASKKHWLYSIGPKKCEKAMVLQYHPVYKKQLVLQI